MLVCVRLANRHVLGLATLLLGVRISLPWKVLEDRAVLEEMLLNFNNAEEEGEADVSEVCCRWERLCCEPLFATTSAT